MNPSDDSLPPSTNPDFVATATATASTSDDPPIVYAVPIYPEQEIKYPPATSSATASPTSYPFHDDNNDSIPTHHPRPTPPVGIPQHPPVVAPPSPVPQHPPVTVPPPDTAMPPPGVSAGGIWGIMRYRGPATWSTCGVVSVVSCVFCLLPLGLCCLLCRWDSREVYCRNHTLYDVQGKCLGPRSRFQFTPHNKHRG